MTKCDKLIKEINSLGFTLTIEQHTSQFIGGKGLLIEEWEGRVTNGQGNTIAYFNENNPAYKKLEDFLEYILRDIKKGRSLNKIYI